MAGECLMCGKPLGEHSLKGDCNSFIGPDDIVGHKSYATGEIDPATGFPIMCHQPLTRAEGDAIWERSRAAEAKRTADMPDEKSAIDALFSAWLRLKELGWREAMYCPKDGSHFQTIEAGSTGIGDCNYQGEWASGSFWLYDANDVWPSHPILFKLYPEDQMKYDAKMEEAKARYQAGRESSQETPMERSTGNRKYLREEDCEDNDEGA